MPRCASAATRSRYRSTFWTAVIRGGRHAPGGRGAFDDRAIRTLVLFARMELDHDVDVRQWPVHEAGEADRVVERRGTSSPHVPDTTTSRSSAATPSSAPHRVAGGRIGTHQVEPRRAPDPDLVLAIDAAGGAAARAPSARTRRSARQAQPGRARRMDVAVVVGVDHPVLERDRGRLRPPPRQSSPGGGTRRRAGSRRAADGEGPTGSGSRRAELVRESRHGSSRRPVGEAPGPRSTPATSTGASRIGRRPGPRPRPGRASPPRRGPARRS